MWHYFGDLEPSHWRFVVYFYSARRRCQYYPQGLLAPASVLAVIERKRCDHHYTAKTFLLALKKSLGSRLELKSVSFDTDTDESNTEDEDAALFGRHTWRFDSLAPKENKCRTLDMSLDLNIEREIAHALASAEANPKSYMVYLDTGQRVTRNTEKYEQESYAQACQILHRAEPQWDMQKPWLEWVAEQDAKHGDKVRRLQYENIGLVEQEMHLILPHGEGATDDEKVYFATMEKTIVPHLKTCPGTYYTTSANTPRINIAGLGFMQLNRELRKLLFSSPSMRTFDLKACQVAIFAKETNATAALELLRQCHHKEIKDECGNALDLWAFLRREAGLKEEHLKHPIKTAAFHIIYGGQRKNVERDLTKELVRLHVPNPEEVTARVLGSDFMKSLHEASIRYLGEIKAAGEIEMPQWYFNGDLHLRWTKPLRKSTAKTEKARDYDDGRNLRSLVACRMQAIEQSIMLSALDTFKNESVLLLAQIHDGFVLHFNDISKKERISLKIAKAVNEQARELGYYTRLEY